MKLTKNIRAENDQEFSSMLSWIHIGRGTMTVADRLSDYDCLMLRVVDRLKESSSEDFEALRDAPVVFGEHRL